MRRVPRGLGQARTEYGGLGGSKEEDVVGGLVECGCGPMGLHDAGGGVGVGAEEEMAQFVGDDEAEHVAFGELEDVAAGDEILVVNLGINAAAGIVEIGQAKGLMAGGVTPRHDAHGKMARPLHHGTRRNGGREIRRIGGAAIQPFEVNASLGQERGSPGLGLGKRAGGDMGVIE